MDKRCSDRYKTVRSVMERDVVTNIRLLGQQWARDVVTDTRLLGQQWARDVVTKARLVGH